MSTLYITEKPEVATAIANVLGDSTKKNGFYQCGNDQVVWAAGHLLELCEPHEYDARYEKWNLDDLPIVTLPWRRKASPKSAARLKLIGDLLRGVDDVVHAGDTDAEGQLIVDEILEYAGCNKPVKRILVNDLTPRLIERSLANKRDNKEFKGLSDTAVARSVGDFLYGINMTRLYTLKAQHQGVRGVFSVGRIQTPILGLIVRRDREIENHVKRHYFTLGAEFKCGNLSFRGSYIVSDGDDKDEEGRLINESQVKEIIAHANSSEAVVISANSKPKIEPPPLPFDLLSLQAEANRQFGLTPEKTLAITQELRQKNLITYNRSDCRYLSDEQHADAPMVLDSIVSNLKPSDLSLASENADSSIKSNCFNSKHVGAHHAIVPTEQKHSVGSLGKEHAQVYILIAKQYVVQFFKDKRSTVTEVIVDVGGRQFKCTSKETLEAGWEDYFGKGESAREKNPPLSDLVSNSKAGVLDVYFDKKETAPPKPYTHATILKDLRSIAKYVDDKRISALLKEKDKDKKDEHGGIGTAATRHTFVPTLEARGFVEIKSGKIRSTNTGREFHDALPSLAVKPDMTALWHEQQSKIEKGEIDVMSFLNELAGSVGSHVDEVKTVKLTITSNSPECPDCGSALNLVPGKHGKFWGCSGYPACKSSFPNKAGKPDFSPKQNKNVTEHPCECGSMLVKRASKKNKDTHWYGCSSFPKCKNTYFEKDGKPEYKELKNATA